MPPRDRRLELVTQEAAQGPVPELDTTKAHQARVYDYWLGGKDNFPADRAAAEQAIRDFPGIRAGARAQRAFLGRAVRYLAGPAGLRQFLDIGTGIPAANNTHEVAQAVAPESRVVYVDNDRFKSGCAHAGPVRLPERPRFPGTAGREQMKPPRDLTASDRVGDRCHHVREHLPGMAPG